jgi:hypothetical protein
MSDRSFDHLMVLDETTSSNAARALAEFDLSPSDRRAAVRLLLNSIGPSREVRGEEVRSVLRAIDCEYVARRSPMLRAASPA